MLTPSRIIKREYKRYGFASFFMYGHQGSGKTTYALKILKEVYGGWENVLRYTYFHIDQLIDDLEIAFDNYRRIPAVLVDDAGLAILKYYWQKEGEQWFSRFFNLIRSASSSVIFTSVETDDIVKFIRTKIKYVCMLVRHGDDWSEARGYERVLLPNGKRIERLKFIDSFKLRLPDDIRSHYEELRRDAIKRLFAERRKLKNAKYANLIEHARKLREEGLSWREVAKQIYLEFGIKKSKDWFRRRLAHTVST